MTTATKEKAATATTIAKNDLQAALQTVMPAVPTRAPRPILQNVRLGDGLLTATDLEIRIDREVDYHGEAILLPAQRLAAILKNATGDNVSLKPGGTTVTVKCGGGEWTLPTVSAEEFPVWEPQSMTDICRIPAEQFRRAVKATVYATDSESSRYALGGVRLEVVPTDDGSKQFWVATDGRRLAVVETENDQAVDESNKTVSARVMSVASSMAVGYGSVAIEANDKEVRLTLDGCVVTGRLIDGHFPEWRQVLGVADGAPTRIERQDLRQAVESAAIVSSEQSKGVKLTWTSKTLVLSGRSSEYGESTVKCPLVAAGTTAATKLDPRYLVDFLKGILPEEEPEVDVYAADSASRVLLKCGPYTGVIMPLSEDA